MKTIPQKTQASNKKTIDAAVARVAGAVQVAGVAVSATLAIKNEAMDEVEALRVKSDFKAGDRAMKKISSDTKEVLGNRK